MAIIPVVRGGRIMPNSGRKKNRKKIWTRRGVPRMNSMSSAMGYEIIFLDDFRKNAKTKPSEAAIKNDNIVAYITTGTAFIIRGNTTLQTKSHLQSILRPFGWKMFYDTNFQ